MLQSISQVPWLETARAVSEGNFVLMLQKETKSRGLVSLGLPLQPTYNERRKGHGGLLLKGVFLPKPKIIIRKRYMV